MEKNIYNDVKAKDQFKYLFKDDSEIEDEFEKALEKEIEKNCEFNVYVDKLEIEDKSDTELELMEKTDIINFKNYQISKLKAYIYSLEKEKEDLIENFKNTTNVLLEKIKENEFSQTGVRPQTPHIAKKIKKEKMMKLEEMKKAENRLEVEGDDLASNKKRCVNCKNEFIQEEFLQHSLECLRNNIKCKKCGELIEERNKKDHLLEWRSVEV
jgi:hypothetical protein